ncbi:MAG: 2-C-methyl-D-erythritol 4-phosphate cytidylyltransferase [Leptospira sp.]|nr:2-C-methyl-D-erythritol 4-phosphate cytidylyltransferase [Leptospira sp.]
MKFSSNSIYVILLAGGVGARLGAGRPKQFLKLQNETLLRRSTRKFREWGFVKAIVIVSHPESIMEVETNLSDVLQIDDRIVEGGETRHDSTLNGLQALTEMGATSGDFVMIHDVARPFFLHSELDSLLASARVHEASTLAVPCSDTLVREKTGTSIIENSLSREGVWQVKTPQVASWNLLQSLRSLDYNSEITQPQSEENAISALLAKYDPTRIPTDLCTWLLAHGKATGLVKTSDWNMKVTRPGDMEMAEAYLASLKLTYPDLE